MGEVQFSFVIYSDDGGTSWSRSAALDLNASDECEVVELSDGALYMNMRHQGSRGKRAYAYSRDGGETWSPVAFDSRLPEPSCQGSMVRFPASPRAPAGILLCCPANPASRDHLTLRVSYDDCRNWPASKLLYSGPAAYSDLAVAADGTVLCLFEADEYRRLLLARFRIEGLVQMESAGECPERLPDWGKA
jgi:sialidase-1